MVRRFCCCRGLGPPQRSRSWALRSSTTCLVSGRTTRTTPRFGNLPLSRIAFEMWLRGRPVPMDGVRDYLIATATLHDRVARVLQIFGFGGAVLPNRVLRWVAKIARRQQPAGIGLIRRRLDNDQGRTETVIRASAEMVAGVYVPPQYVMGPDDDEGNLFEAVLGIEAARTEAPIGLQPWLRGSLTETLVDATRDFAGEWTRVDPWADEASSALAAALTRSG